ncbi:MAG: aminotransferase class I/II-fold pyridoxal phosphate-dependent enzyme [bacterium]|nr:aminotransferase class I/II-fold pyridoxal phosphate-dependent enzyme [bacterium]
MIKLAKAAIGPDEMAQIQRVFDVGWLGMGVQTLEFETAVKEYLGAGHVIAVNTGTSALHLSLACLGIGPGDEVIVPSLTYVASFQAIAMTGATPVSCESDPETLLIDLDDAEKRLSPRTKAVMPVHYAGQPCDMRRLLSWREKYGLRVVEDAAHAFGSFYGGAKVGSFGDVTCFSFDSIKIITCGEGGVIATNDAELADAARNARLLGVDRESEFRYKNERKWFYDVPCQGYRYHLSNINAAIGLAQLAKLGEFIERRREICLHYDRAFQPLERIRTIKVDYSTISPFAYIIRVESDLRDEFMNWMKARQIETGIHYLPNHWHSMFRREGESLPVADRLGREIVTLPLHSRLTNDEVDAVIEAVTNFHNEID